MTEKSVMWTLKQALVLVRMLQPDTRKFNYHLALGGGVLNCGVSHRDLDLYFLPLDDNNEGPHPPNAPELLAHLQDLWGEGELLIGSRYEHLSRYTKKWKFMLGAQRIDVFIMGGSIG